jgi:hypothetical protein
VNSPHREESVEHSVNGILLLYHHYIRDEAPTIMEHVNAFLRLSGFKAWGINVELGLPTGIRELRFRAIVMHYSLFGDYPFRLGGEFLRYVEQCRESYKIAFFQDEYQFCPQRFDVLNRLNIDCVFTLLEPDNWSTVYRKNTSVKRFRHTLTGYVDDGLVELAQRLGKPDEQREIDVGYRARRLPFRMGKGGQEKAAIATEFERRAAESGLVLDVKPGAHRRLNGLDWYRFVANCKGFLGVEAGVSVFDLDDNVRLACEEILRTNPAVEFEEVEEKLLAPLEGNVFYRTISPRHFEAAAFKVCQILFEGSYTGILQPMVHYIPLKKDFSNFDEVIRLFRDNNVRRTLTENAYRDLIASGRFSYREFIRGYDEELSSAGLQGIVDDPTIQLVDDALKKGELVRRIRGLLLTLMFLRFPGRTQIIQFYKKSIKPHIWKLRGKTLPVQSNQQPS